MARTGETIMRDIDTGPSGVAVVPPRIKDVFRVSVTPLRRLIYV
jgi:hypothetical protein